MINTDRIAVTRAEAARLVSLSVAEIDNERRAGRLIGRKHGRKVLIPIDELRRWVEELQTDE